MKHQISRTGGSRILSLLLVAILILGGLTSLFVTPAAVAQATVAVSIKGFAFNPGTITVVLGVNNTVTWTNNDGVYHTVTANDGTWGSNVSPGIAPGASFTYTFAAADSFGYHCSIHPYMMGTVIVIAGGSSTTSSTSSSSSSLTTSTTSTTSTTTTTSKTSTTTPSTTTTSPTTTTQTVTQPPVTTTVTSTGSSSPTTTTSSSGAIPEFPFQGILVTVLTLGVLAAYFLVRRTNRGQTPSPSAGE